MEKMSAQSELTHYAYNVQSAQVTTADEYQKNMPRLDQITVPIRVS